MTPLVNAGWDWDARRETFTVDHPELYPFELRPQGNDIISFWLFHTVVECYEHTGEVPFDSVIINGMVLDENHEATSKSRGNVIPPGEVLAEFPVNAARYWAAGTSIGDDFPYKEGNLEAGETAMEVISALRRYETERGLALNADLGTVEVFGRVAGFEDAIAETMHVEQLERRADNPEITTEIAGVDPDYSVVGPEFGAAVDDIDAAIEAGEFEVDGDRLVVADEYELESVRFVEGGEYATVDCRYETWFLLRPGTLLVPAHLIGELAAALRACDVAVPGWRDDAEPATQGSTFARLRLAVLLVALVAGPVVAVLG